MTFPLQVIKTGDMMELLTGGYYKPTIHRVVQPPEDQRELNVWGHFILRFQMTMPA
jgi:hypothetical protein